MIRTRSKVRAFSYFITVIVLLGLLPGGMPGVVQGQSITLPADLFFLTGSGRVMRISAGGTFATAISPPGQQVVDFGPAPDGQWIAYRTAGSEEESFVPYLGVTSIDGQSGQVIEFEQAGLPPISGRGQTLAWSPDGAAIAYTTPAGIRIYLSGLGEPVFVDLEGGPFINLVWSPGGGYLAAEAESDVWWVYRRAGAALSYAGQVPGSAGLDWVQEAVLALAPPSGSLLTLDVRDGTQAGLLPPETIISNPTRIGTGRLNFALHEATGQRFAARRFGTVSVSGGDYQEFESALELTRDMRWMPDGTALTAIQDGTLVLIEPRTGTRREIIEGVKAYCWGQIPPQEVTGVVLPAELYFLSRDEAGIPQVWKLPADGSPVTQITAEPRPVLDFAVSPDASQIAFSSGGRLIVASSDGSAGRELSPLVERLGTAGQPAWNADGSMIAFVRDGIWIVPSGGGARTELITDNLTAETPPDQVRVYMNPRWSPDGMLLLIDISYYEGRSLGFLPIAGGDAADISVAAGRGTWSPDGRALIWDAGSIYSQPGLYVVDPHDIEHPITVLDSAWPVADVMPLAPEAATVLHGTSSDTMGPSVIQPFLVPILPDAIPIPHGQGGLLEEPVLSPGGTRAAGLRSAGYSDYGLAGRLVIVNLENGERTAVVTPGEVWGLRWGPRVVTAP